MNEEFQALHDLELAFNRWYRVTGQRIPDVGIVVISVSEDSTELQYLGRDPEMEVDWDRFFRELLRALAAGKGVRIPGSAIKFPSQR